MFAILKKILKKKEDFSHLDSKGKATMVSVVEKERSHRVACARAFIKASNELIEKLKQNDLKKGDAITVAKIAGIRCCQKNLRANTSLPSPAFRKCEGFSEIR